MPIFRRIKRARSGDERHGGCQVHWKACASGVAAEIDPGLPIEHIGNVQQLLGVIADHLRRHTSQAVKAEKHSQRKHRQHDENPGRQAHVPGRPVEKAAQPAGQRVPAAWGGLPDGVDQQGDGEDPKSQVEGREAVAAEGDKGCEGEEEGEEEGDRTTDDRRRKIDERRKTIDDRRPTTTNDGWALRFRVPSIPGSPIGGRRSSVSGWSVREDVSESRY